MGRLMRSVLRVVPAGIVVLTGASLVAGCGSGGGGQTFNVSVDGTNPNANETFLNYFPAQTRVHPGDKVVFTLNGPGEPHTITLGTLVDQTLSAFQALPPSQQENPPQSVIALDAKLPQLLPNLNDASQSAANPCFLASGTPPPTAACPSGSDKQPDFDGKQAYYNSGWSDVGDKFTVKVADDTAPGTYQFMCLLHREGMTGKLTVVDKATTIPSPSDQQKFGQAQQNAIEAKLAAPLALLRKGKPPVPQFQLPGTNVILAGSGSPDQSVTGSISEFGPQQVSIPVGGSVTWWFIGPHSVTFGSDDSNDDIRTDALRRHRPSERGRRQTGRRARRAAEAAERRLPDKSQVRGRRVRDLERLRVPELGRLHELVRAAGDRGLHAEVHESRDVQVRLHRPRRHEGNGGRRRRLAQRRRSCGIIAAA